MYTVELISCPMNANMYGIYDKTGKAIGDVEEIIGGVNAGRTVFYPLTYGYTRNDLRKIFKEYRGK